MTGRRPDGNAHPSQPAQRVRLLYLTPEPWPTFRADIAALFGKHLPNNGVDTDLVTVVASREPSKPWGGGAAILCNAGRGQAGKYLRMFFHFASVLLRADWRRYDAVQVRDMPLAALLALLLARWHGRPFFYWMSYPMSEGFIALARERGLGAGWMRFLFPWLRGHLGKFLLRKVLLPRADHVFVQSEQMKRELVASGVDPDRMTPVPMGVDLSALDAGSGTVVRDPRFDGRRVIGYLGTLERPRRIEVLFEMLQHLRQQWPHVLLLIVGDTTDVSQRERLRALAAEAGVNDLIVWAGWVPIDQAWALLRNSEIGLSPVPRSSLLDVGSPTKVVEYLALNLPVICNDNPDQAEVVGVTGAGLCVPYTGSDFAEAVSNLLALDLHERKRMALRGRAYVEAHRDYRVVAAQLAAAYRAVLHPDAGAYA